MKKTVAIILALCMVFALCACGQGSASSASAKIKIGMVTDVGGVNDKSSTRLPGKAFRHFRLRIPALR